MKSEKNRANKILFGKYEIQDYLGGGAYGNVYLTTNIKTNMQYAVKLENRSTPYHFLENETYFLYSLKVLEFLKSFLMDEVGNIMCL